ncbi:hypothetical protein CK228_17380 [Mesorhizobium sp. WSM4312]|nr:hypothetical protein CK228_17380 [Mesorhizobium sp. WSM4312]
MGPRVDKPDICRIVHAQAGDGLARRLPPAGASAQIRRTLINHGVKRPLVTYAASISDARTQLAEK